MKLGRGAGVKKVPPIGEMDKPVMFYDPEMVPDDFTGFDTTLTPLANAWAKIRFSARSYTKAGDSDSDGVEAHLVIIQNPRVKLPKGTYMVHEQVIYRVVLVTPIDTAGDFLSIYVVDAGDLKDGDFTINDGSNEGAGTESETNPPSDNLWKDGF